MPPDEQQQLDRIESDRRRREQELLLLLMVLSDESRQHAQHAVRLGHNPIDAASRVWYGERRIDQPGLAPALAEAMADADAAGYRRALRFAGGAPMPTDAAELERLTLLYEPAAHTAVSEIFTPLRDRLDIGLKEASPQGTKEVIRALRDIYNAGRYGRNNPAALAAEATTRVCRAYGNGMGRGFRLPEIDVKLWGYRYRTMRDEKVRSNHAAMEGVTRPKADSVWDWWTPPAGYNCRCVLLPLFTNYPYESTPELPDVMPDPGFPMWV